MFSYSITFFRFVGPATSVHVHCPIPPRLEVRTVGQAVSELGSRLALLVLTPQQLDLLTAPRVADRTSRNGQDYRVDTHGLEVAAARPRCPRGQYVHWKPGRHAADPPSDQDDPVRHGNKTVVTICWDSLHPSLRLWKTSNRYHEGLW